MSRIAKIVAVAAGAGTVLLTGTGLAMADADAKGTAIGSPGIISGNNVQAPIHIPANICGNTVNVLAALNPAAGNVCINAEDIKHDAKHHNTKHDHGKHHGKHHGKKH